MSVESHVLKFSPHALPEDNIFQNTVAFLYGHVWVFTATQNKRMHENIILETVWLHPIILLIYIPW
jgi:hypothetical protein